MIKSVRMLVVAGVAAIGINSYAQDDAGQLRADFQFDAQTYTADSLIKAPEVSEKVRGQGFLNVLYTRGKFQAGARYEGYFTPLQGIDPRFDGNGIPYRFARYTTDEIDVTLGNFYEQFGSGMILRTYEERQLGFDNSIDGVRFKTTPLNGINLTALFGRQRTFFDLSDGILRGADAEITLNDLSIFGENWMGQEVRTKIGGSVVSKFQTANDPLLKYPQNVFAYSTRVGVQIGSFTLDGEYMYKINDPAESNTRSFNPGNGLLVNATYSGKGWGLTLSGKRIDNLDFRSDREATGNNLVVNFLPPVTKQHTYRLITLYPYATQPNGEIGFQGEFVYTFAKNSFLGGDYGTTITANYSQVHLLQKTRIDDYTYTTTFFGVGKMPFSDFNVEITKQWSKDFKTNFMVIAETYDKDIIETPEGFGVLHPISIVGEFSCKLSATNNIRVELQHMSVKRDLGDWIFALAEYTIAPHWYFTAFNEYNYGNEDPERRIHYPNVSTVFIKNGTRFSFGYGKTRAGILCVGGVCRVVPAANGFTLSITSTL